MRNDASLRVTRRAHVSRGHVISSAAQEKNKYLPNLSLPHFRLISPRPRRLYRSRRTVRPHLPALPLGQPLTPGPARPRRCHRLQRIPRTLYSAVRITLLSIYFCRISIPFTYPINYIMAFKSYPLPSITTSLPGNPPAPVTASSTAESSPITPLSELSGSSNLTPSSCSASARNYVTYPTGVTPPRQLTPPPTSRFVPLFKSYSKPDNLEDTPSSVPVSRGHRSASAILDKSFSPTISRPAPSPLTLAPASVHVEQPPKSAPMRTSHPAPWHTPSQAAEHIEKLNDIIAGLRHQLTLKSFDLETSQAELTRISDAYAILVREKAKITDKYIRVKQRLDELEVQVQADERYIARQVKERADFAYQQARLSQEQDELRQWSEFQSGRYDVREKALQNLGGEAAQQRLPLPPSGHGGRRPEYGCQRGYEGTRRTCFGERRRSRPDSDPTPADCSRDRRVVQERWFRLCRLGEGVWVETSGEYTRARTAHLGGTRSHE
jgi:hypothetical protein